MFLFIFCFDIIFFNYFFNYNILWYDFEWILNSIVIFENDEIIEWNNIIEMKIINNVIDNELNWFWSE